MKIIYFEIRHARLREASLEGKLRAEQSLLTGQQGRRIVNFPSVNFLEVATEIFLGVGPSLSCAPRSYVLLNLLPILAIELQGSQKGFVLFVCPATLNTLHYATIKIGLRFYYLILSILSY
jgi:hypothetical protein